MSNIQNYVTHVALHQSINAVVDAIHCVTTIDAVPYEGANGSVHPAGRCPNVHHAQVEATLTNREKSVLGKYSDLGLAALASSTLIH